jgi:hypothetical protein
VTSSPLSENAAACRGTALQRQLADRAVTDNRGSAFIHYRSHALAGGGTYRSTRVSTGPVRMPAVWL